MYNPLRFMYNIYYRISHKYREQDIRYIINRIEQRFSYHSTIHNGIILYNIQNIKLEGTISGMSDNNRTRLIHLNVKEGIVSVRFLYVFKPYQELYFNKPIDSFIEIIDIRKILWKNLNWDPNKALEDYLTGIISKYIV